MCTCDFPEATAYGHCSVTVGRNRPVRLDVGVVVSVEDGAAEIIFDNDKDVRDTTAALQGLLEV